MRTTFLRHIVFIFLLAGYASFAQDSVYMEDVADEYSVLEEYEEDSMAYMPSPDSMEIDGAAEQPVDIGKLTILVKDFIHKLEVPMNLLTLVVKEMELIQKRSRQDICGSIGNMELVP